MASSLQQGINAAKAGHADKALDFLKDAIIEEPQNADVWVWIAAIIDDLDKQEIFLNKALEIDPNNIPAQRGLAYLQKRKQEATSNSGDHLLDHTSPISPFPPSDQPKQPDRDSGWSKLDLAALNDSAQNSADANVNYPLNHEAKSQNPQKLSPIEFALLGVVVFVFSIIGLLTASALFKFNLPLAFLNGNRPRLTTDPPHAGVFLYESNTYFHLQEHNGVPTSDKGIPTSFEILPVLVFWGTDVKPDEVNLIFETGEYISFQRFPGKNDSELIQPEKDVQSGLYCLQKITETQTTADAQYWCFTVALPEPEG